MKKNKNKYWKSLEEFKNPKPFREAAKNEFPESVLEAPSKMSRKKFLSIMGASIALATLSGCRKPVQKIVPYVNQPEGSIPGIPKYYATTMPFGLNSFGVIVENHEGRPTHIEGNKNHPSSLGATNAFVQASVLDLYDPDRSKLIRNGGKRSSWKKLVETIEQIKKDNKKIAILSPSFASPSIYKIKTELNIPWYCYDPVSNENELNGIRQIFGSKKNIFANYSFDADCILSIDSDFLGADENSVKNTKQFSKKRKPLDREHPAKKGKDYTPPANATMNRLYVVEGSLTTTGAMADNRKRLKQSAINQFVYDLWKCFKKKEPVSADNFTNQVYLDLKRSNSLIRGGARLSSECHALIIKMNQMLKSKYVEYIKKDSACTSNSEGYKELLESMNNEEVDCLIMLDSNPVYFSKNNQKFKEALSKVGTSIHFGPHYDETAALSDWHIPKAHYLESWGDCESLDGTVSIVQPLISPLYAQAYSDLDLLYMLKNPSGYKKVKSMETAYKVIRDRYRGSWTKYLHNGIVKTNSNTLSDKDKNKIEKFNPSKDSSGISAGNEIVFYTSNQVYDGRFANNSWLQESPDPISKVTWDNVALISEKTAKELKVKNKEFLSLSFNGATVEVPTWILPGQADGQISLQVGYGRDFKSRVAKSVGRNVYPLMNGALSNSSVKVSGTGILATIACTQDHHGMDADDSFSNSEIQDRLPDIYREMELEDYKDYGGYNFVAKRDKKKHLKIDGKMKTLYDNPYEKYYDSPERENGYDKPYDSEDPPQWGMTIDLNSCTGCNSCSIACQSENNIPTVGKDQVAKGREMSWIRTDRYFKGTDADNPEVAFQPVTCMHCENAPCEQVCPVSATVHDKEGLNAMVYNRCIGTRYCSNNCPYKVRRFNFHSYTYDTPEVVQMAHNPDVTIRFRGVMEKCSFCLQRIKEVEHKSNIEKKPLKDFELKAACQSACPADCIEFGDIKHKDSPLNQAKKSDRNYSLLAQLNTRPRTTYLAKLRNPNPKISKS